MERGIYTDESGVFDDYYYFQIRFQKCIFSYQSALYLHGLTDRIPFLKEVTLYKGYNSHTIPSNVAVHFAKREIYELGVVFKKAINAFFSLRKKDLNALYYYAEKINIVNEVNDLVEVFYE